MVKTLTFSFTFEDSVKATHRTADCQFLTLLDNKSFLLFAVQYVSLPSQGSEIFTVVAKDGDVGNANPIRYSFDDGEHFTMHTVAQL